jgi:hypothetical protein
MNKVKEKCKVEWCELDAACKGYCKKHRRQIIKYGHVTKTRYDKNEYILHNDYAEIVIENSKLGTCKIQIDLEDVEKCKKYKWFIQHADGNYYRVCSHKKGETGVFKLHRFLMNVLNKSKKIEVDHIDGNPFNNRKTNLRLCSHIENQKNLKTPSHNTSGTKGVYYDNREECWIAEIIYNNKHIHIGKSKDKNEAIKMRTNKELELYGEYSRLNTTKN